MATPRLHESSRGILKPQHQPEAGVTAHLSVILTASGGKRMPLRAEEVGGRRTL